MQEFVVGLTCVPSANLYLDQGPDHENENEHENEEGGTCLGKYSKGNLVVFLSFLSFYLFWFFIFFGFLSFFVFLSFLAFYLFWHLPWKIFQREFVRLRMSCECIVQSGSTFQSKCG